MKERYKLIPEVFLLLVKDEKILLSRRFQTGYEDGNYGLPAGHGEDRETMRQGVAREAKEEINIDIELDDLHFKVTQHRWSPNEKDSATGLARIGFYFEPTKWKGEPTNMEPDKCDDLTWFALDALPENTIDHVRTAIEAYKNNKPYDEFNWQTLT